MTSTAACGMELSVRPIGEFLIPTAARSVVKAMAGSAESRQRARSKVERARSRWNRPKEAKTATLPPEVERCCEALCAHVSSHVRLVCEASLLYAERCQSDLQTHCEQIQRQRGTADSAQLLEWLEAAVAEIRGRALELPERSSEMVLATTALRQRSRSLSQAQLLLCESRIQQCHRAVAEEALSRLESMIL